MGKLLCLALLLIPATTAAAERPLEGKSLASGCQWQAVLAPVEVRFPVQMDTHAAYAIYSFQADASTALKVEGQFPFAAFLSFTTYDAKGLLFDALLDKDIAPDAGSVNPFHEGALVDAPDRSYTIEVVPHGQAAEPNLISMPPIPAGATSAAVTLVLRIYLPEPDLPGPNPERLGGVPLPGITAVSARDPEKEVPCPPAPQMKGPADFGSFSGVPQPPAPKRGKILFYRPPVSMVPFADGSSQLTPDECTSYLMATLDPDKVAVIRFKAPTFFDNTDTHPSTTFAVTQVRYLSLGSYGASLIPPPGSKLGGNIAGPDIRQTLMRPPVVKE